ncbi:TPA: hypothetical protein N0F65_010149 [Lagenidium giganteum]|uniref:2,4-dienoyl-CoA reductase [(3E)-enoyl-CoA-producing] n=1 Tax=Lagenidium giganteum TaxID=4803 RepID=A0AAV2Z8K2_9STRA|nr:TPA: hypothetical protein N0F65_010149 [Lagenidium giganteum]
MDAAMMKRVFRDDVCQGRVALVTGGGSGIGQEIALTLAALGAKVAVMGRRAPALQDTVDQAIAQGATAMFVQGDVRSEDSAKEAVRKVVDAFGKLDVLVNCAAGNFLSLAETLSTNAFRTVIEIDTIGSFNMCRAAFEPLKKSGDGRIINISATLQFPATWFQVHASAAKAALDSVTRSLALEWGAFGIRVMGIAPGPIADTAGTTKLVGDVDPAMINEYIKQMIPVGRAGTKCDIAGTVAFLVSPAGSFASGDTWIVDGGAYLYKEPMMPREAVASWSKQMEKKTRTPKAKL